ncbi:MAG: PfkB family carbohydrate kinase, partial [Actinomycetota bacterium]|nr:PfkB family carbohydrate kinase [Actinomycetota bacterium]
MSSLDLLSIGRVSVDLYAEQPGVTMSDVTTFRKSIGGTATNVAVATARYGPAVALATRVGDDHFGRYVADALRNTFNVDPRFVATHPTLKTPLAFAELDPPEDPTIIFYREPAAPDMEIETTPQLLDAVDTARIFWIPASRFAFDRSRTTVTELLQRRNRKHHTVLDLDWRPMFWDSEEQAHAAISPMLDHVTI